jgi:hypothetical protein
VTLAVPREGEGLADFLSFDFVDPERGAAGLVWLDNGNTHAEGILFMPDGGAVAARDVSVSDDGERARVAFDVDGTGLEIGVTRIGRVSLEPGSAFSDASGLTQEAWAARVDGEWRLGGSSGRVDTLGGVVRRAGSVDWTAVDLIRSLTAVLEDGSLLAVATARPVGASGHGEEAASAVFLDSAGSLTRFEEPLLSTEYDSAGWPRRAGLELWGPDDDAPALRGAGTLIAGNEDTAFLRFSFDSTPGTARYELMRAAE